MNWDSLYSSAFVLSIREGMVDEYRRRHAEVWPEMQTALLASGIVRYDIFLLAGERKVFGHMVRTVPFDPSAPTDPVILRWRIYMADVLEMDGDQPRRETIEQVFALAANG